MDLVFHKHGAEPCDSSWLSLLPGEGGLDCPSSRRGGLLAGICAQAWAGNSSPSLPSREKKDFLSSSLPRGPGRACSRSSGSSPSLSLSLAPAPPKSICCLRTAGTQRRSTFSWAGCCLSWRIQGRRRLRWPKARASLRLVFVLWSQQHQSGLTWLHARHANQLLHPCIHLPGVFPAFFLSSPHCERGLSLRSGGGGSPHFHCLLLRFARGQLLRHWPMISLATL